MFKEENQIWLYLIGIIIMFGLLFAGTTNVLVPSFKNSSSLNIFKSNFNTAPKFLINPKLDYYAIIDTNLGSFSIDLFEKNTPSNTNNFIYLANNNYYSNTKFHRLVPKFLLQGGDRNTLNKDPDDDGKGRTGYLINDEINWESLNLDSQKRTILTELGYTNSANIITPKFEKYFIGMANGGPNTNSSQFFILINDMSDDRINQLNGMYTPIGKVIDGFETVDQLSNITVKNSDQNTQAQSSRPSVDIIIQKITVLTK